MPVSMSATFVVYLACETVLGAHSASLDLARLLLQVKLVLVAAAGYGMFKYQPEKRLALDQSSGTGFQASWFSPSPDNRSGPLTSHALMQRSPKLSYLISP